MWNSQINVTFIDKLKKVWWTTENKFDDDSLLFRFTIKLKRNYIGVGRDAEKWLRTFVMF